MPEACCVHECSKPQPVFRPWGYQEPRIYDGKIIIPVLCLDRHGRDYTIEVVRELVITDEELVDNYVRGTIGDLNSRIP